MDGAASKSGPLRPTIGSGMPMPKLKGSCDMCSASKVRCDKQKPICGRCKNLEYPCFYSPSRRVGRPHRSRASIDIRPPKLLRTPSPEKPSVSAIGGAGGDESLNTQQRDAPCFNNGLTPSPLLLRMEDGILDKIESPQRVRRRSESAQSIVHIPKQSTTDTGTSKTCELDCCGSIVLDLLEHLDTAGKILQQRTSRDDPGPGEYDLGRASSIVKSAYPSVSTVLICPCSEEPGIAMLAAAACLSMLDIQSAVIGAVRPRSDDAFASLIFDQDALLQDSTNSSSSKSTNSTNSPVNQDLASMRAFAELSRVAIVVLQFAVKYGEGDLEQDSPDFLRALASFLRFRLQCITIEATRRLEN